MGGLASSVGAMTGIGNSAAAQGLGWNPGQAGLLNPVTNQQAQDAYTQSQTGIANQAAFLQALQGQNGIQNQSSVYNQLQGVANGTGPNPAQALLAQSTGANTANQAALMAGQRGAGANVGLIARQAAQQGGANQQAAAGQAATMQANQSLGALNQLGGIAGQQVGQQAAATGALTGAQQSEQGLLYGQVNAQNEANIKQSQGINQIQAAQAAQGAQAQTGLIGGGAGALMAMNKGGPIQSYADGGFTLSNDYSLPASNIQSPSSSQPSGAPQAPSGPKSFIGKIAQGLAPKAPGPAGGGSDNPLNNMYQSGQQAGNAIGSGIGKGLKGLFGSNSDSNTSMPDGSVAGDSNNFESAQLSMPQMGSEFATAAPALAKGGPVPAMVSPGERYLNPREVKKVAEGKKDAASAGEKIPGKAKVKGDSLKNDTVPKTLEEGGIVLPKSVMESKRPHWEAHKFVSAILKKQGLYSKKK